MKKIITLLFVAAALAACGSDKKNDTASTVSETQLQENSAAATMAEEQPAMEEAAADEAPAVEERSKVWTATAETPETVDSDIPAGGDKLFAFLKSKAYQNYANQEKETHPSKGPHTKFGLPVRVYFNDKIATSLKAKNAEHPVGAGIVKEMFNKEGVLEGWAVIVKTQATSDSGKGWFWYEVTSTEDNSFSNIPAEGNGVPGCIGCHAAGADMVVSDYSTL